MNGLRTKILVLSLLMGAIFSQATNAEIIGVTSINPAQVNTASCDETKTWQLYAGEYAILWDHFYNNSRAPTFIQNYMVSSTGAYILVNPTLTNHNTGENTLLTFNRNLLVPMGWKINPGTTVRHMTTAEEYGNWNGETTSFKYGPWAFTNPVIDTLDGRVFHNANIRNDGSHPVTPTPESSFDAEIRVATLYDLDDKTSTAADNHVVVECAHYVIRWCGDGILDTTREQCDNNDTTHTGWGTGGCNATCAPINTGFCQNGGINGQQGTAITLATPGLCQAGFTPQNLQDILTGTTRHDYTWECRSSTGDVFSGGTCNAWFDSSLNPYSACIVGNPTADCSTNTYVDQAACLLANPAGSGRTCYLNNITQCNATRASQCPLLPPQPTCQTLSVVDIATGATPNASTTLPFQAQCTCTASPEFAAPGFGVDRFDFNMTGANTGSFSTGTTALTAIWDHQVDFSGVTNVTCDITGHNASGAVITTAGLPACATSFNPGGGNPYSACVAGQPTNPCNTYANQAACLAANPASSGRACYLNDITTCMANRATQCPPQLTCNEACTTDAQCAGITNGVCDSTSGTCRNSGCKEQTDCICGGPSYDLDCSNLSIVSGPNGQSTAICTAMGNYNHNAPLNFDIRKYTISETNQDAVHGTSVASGSTMTGASMSFTIPSIVVGDTARCFVRNNNIGPYTNGNCTKGNSSSSSSGGGSSSSSGGGSSSSSGGGGCGNGIIEPGEMCEPPSTQVSHTDGCGCVTSCDHDCQIKIVCTNPGDEPLITTQNKIVGNGVTIFRKPSTDVFFHVRGFSSSISAACNKSETKSAIVISNPICAFNLSPYVSPINAIASPYTLPASQNTYYRPAYIAGQSSVCSTTTSWIIPTTDTAQEIAIPFRLEDISKFTGYTSHVPVNPGYADVSSSLTNSTNTDVNRTGLIFAYKKPDGTYDSQGWASIRVAKSIISNTSGGNAYNPTGTQVNTVAGGFIDTLKTGNFTTAASGSGWSLTKNTTTTPTTTTTTTIVNSTTKTTGTTTTQTVSTLNQISNLDKLGDQKNVHVLKNGDLTLALTENLSGVHTVVIENGNLIITKNMKYANTSASWAFVVKKGDILIDKDVTSIAGVFMTLGAGKGIKAKGNIDSALQLKVDGSFYGDPSNLIEHRTYVYGTSTSTALATGVVINYSNRALKFPPPLLTNFIETYKLQKVSK